MTIATGPAARGRPDAVEGGGTVGGAHHDTAEGSVPQHKTADGATADDYAPFGSPLFDDPSARALARVGVIDVGSNSVRMVVFDGAARSPAYFFNEKVMCGLGAGIAETGVLSPEGRVRALAALKRFRLLASGMGVAPLTAVATAAVREASDGQQFRAEVEDATGIRLWVVDGPEEARLSAQGVLLGWPGAEGLVCDIGGASMELAMIGDGQIGRRVTSPLGPLRLQNLDGGRKGRRAEIERAVAALTKRVGIAHERMFLVGGSWRAIARLDMERRGYPLRVLHEYAMSPEQIAETAAWMAEHDADALRKMTGIGEARMALVPIAMEVLQEVLGQIEVGEIAISSYGIREGMLYEQMPQRLRDRDPLIEACRYAEQRDARMPGFGRALYGFVAPLFAGAGVERLRIVRAACLLHDVSWRAHPDYRHEVCFDNATRANLGGLTHVERVFLGLALFHRYKNSRGASRFEDIVSLLSADEIAAAESLGRAMRFGAMFSGDTADALGTLDWDAEAKALTLHLPANARDLYGEVAAARFKALCAAMGARGEVATGD